MSDRPSVCLCSHYHKREKNFERVTTNIKKVIKSALLKFSLYNNVLLIMIITLWWLYIYTLKLLTYNNSNLFYNFTKCKRYTCDLRSILTLTFIWIGSKTEVFNCLRHFQDLHFVKAVGKDWICLLLINFFSPHLKQINQ